jgi:hypothetical protein
VTRRRDNPPGLDAAIRSFEGFHAYDSKEVGQFPASMRIPEYVQVLGPCTYVTYRSDKWNDGSHDYVHEIESYPRVLVGLVGGRQGKRRKVPQRIGNDATLVQVRTSAIGFGYTDGAGEKIDSTVRRCTWFWHPRGKALLLVREMRQLVAIIWGGKLGFEDRGIVG